MPSLGAIQIRFVSPSDSAKGIGSAAVTLDTVVIRQLVAMPNEDLITRLAVDPQLRRQSEALNAATATSDVISRIRWAYMVLEEQQNNKKHIYHVCPAFKHIRDGVSHPQLTNSNAVAYFRKNLGADFPDVLNPLHMKFLRQKSKLLLREAIRIVEEKLADQKFWL